MAQAGYDPHEAVAFWERMSGCPRNMIGKLCFRSGAGVPEFLSTHPSEETRNRNIDRWIPAATHYYDPPSDTPRTTSPSKARAYTPAPKRHHIQTILLIGSSPVVIG